MTLRGEEELVKKDSGRGSDGDGDGDGDSEGALGFVYTRPISSSPRGSALNRGKAASNFFVSSDRRTSISRNNAAAQSSPRILTTA